MKQAEIIIKQAILTSDNIRWLEGFVFVNFKNILSLDDVPLEYVKTSPYFHFSNDTLEVFYKTGMYKKYRIGDFISKEDFHKLISILKQAGQRLSNINKKIKNNRITNKKITIKI